MTKAMTREEVIEAIKDGSIVDVLKSENFVSYGNFTMDAVEGLTKHEVKGNGKSMRVETLKISASFEVLGACRDPNGREWGKLLRFHDADGREHLRHVTDATLQGEPAALCAMLASEGLSINRSHQRELAEYLSSVVVTARVTHVERTGWHKIGDSLAFVFPHQTISGSTLKEQVVLNSSARGYYEVCGTLGDWQAGVGALSKDHVMARFAISASLAGALAEFADGESGGFSFCGQSSIGKSSLLCVAASVWGRGSEKDGFIRSWRSTANALEGSAAGANDTALILDELGAGEAKDVSAAIYQLANGVGKGRLNRDGSLRDPKSWRVAILSSGEVSIDTKISEDKGRKARAGQTVRLLDIPADRSLGFGVFDCTGSFQNAGQLADACKQAAGSAYGTAGPAFIRALLELDRDELTAWLKKRIASFVARVVPGGASEQIGRAAKRFALVAAAGELATAFGVTPWAKGDARGAAVGAFEAWLANRGGASSHEERQSIEQVRRMIIQHGESRFEAVSEIEGNINIGNVQNRLGWRKGEGDEREWWVPPEVWKVEFCDGLDPTYVAKVLAAKGMLKRQDRKNLTAVRKVGGRNSRFYVLTASILGAEDQ